MSHCTDSAALNSGELQQDFEHRYYGYHDRRERRATCRVRVFDTSFCKVVVMSELPENESTSITNRSECLATELYYNLGLQAEVSQGRIPVFIEHYPADSWQPERFSVISYQWGPNQLPRYHAYGQYKKAFRSPRWDHIEPLDLAEILQGDALFSLRPRQRGWGL